MPAVRVGTLQNQELSASEKSALVKTLNSWLRPKEAISLELELPLVFENSGAHHVFLEDAEGMLGHAGILPTQVYFEDRPYSVTLISSVGIRPDRRGEGWGKMLISACEKTARPPFILWSNKTGFYRKLGFEPFGREKLVVLTCQNQNPIERRLPDDDDSRLLIREAKEEDIPGLELLHAGNRSFCRRTREQWLAFLRTPQSRIFVLMNHHPGGRPVAFAAMGKGLDFPETIHDLGGSTPDLSRLLRNLPKFLKRNTACLLPNDELFPFLPISKVEDRPFALAKGGEKLPNDLHFGGFSSV